MWANYWERGGFGGLRSRTRISSSLVSCHVGPLFGERPTPFSSTRILHIYYTNSKIHHLLYLPNKKRNLIKVVELKRAP